MAKQMVKKFFSTTLTIAMVASSIPAHASPATDSANARFLSWFGDQEKGRLNWLEKRGLPGGPPYFLDFYYPKPIALTPMTAEEAKIARETKELYDQYFPPTDTSSYVNTWIESGHPYDETKYGPYQWNSHKGSGIDDNAPFHAMMKKLVDLKIKSVRIGPQLHEIDPAHPESWDHFLDKIEVMWRDGATPTISVVFFSSLKRWQVLNSDGTVNYDKSYLLNPNWPADMGVMTKAMMERLYARAEKVEKLLGHRPRVVINPVNEPETLAGFNRNFWHGAHAPWGSKEMMKYYVPSLINIAKTNVEIRKAVEEVAAGHNDRILFMHNEAMTTSYYPSHHGYGRFALSKFMLGDKIVTLADFDKYLNEPLSHLKSRIADRYSMTIPYEKRNFENVNEVDWAFNEYVFGEWNTTDQQREDARRTLVAQFKELQAEHESLVKQTGKTMKVDNFLDVDYYEQGEFIMPMTMADIENRLVKNHGEELKNVLGAKTDEAFISTLNEAAADTEKEITGTNLHPGKDRASTDFKKFLGQEDHAMLFKLIGFRNKYELMTQPDLVARQKLAGIPDIKEEFRRSDIFMNALLANNGAKLLKVAGAKNEAELRQALKKIALDTRDGGKAITLDITKGTIRDLLNKENRTVLNRLLGMKPNPTSGFEPQHYARQIRLGMKQGFYKTAMAYVNNLRVFTMGVGESGTPFYAFAPLLHDQMMIEYASVLKAGLFGTHYSFGPAVDTIGWDKGPLSKHIKEDHMMEHSGIMRVTPVKVAGKVAYDTTLTHWDKGDPWVFTFLHHPQFGFMSNFENYMKQDSAKAAGQ